MLDVLGRGVIPSVGEEVIILSYEGGVLTSHRGVVTRVNGSEVDLGDHYCLEIVTGDVVILVSN